MRPRPRAPVRAQISDKNCEKIHYLAPNIYCCGAGTAADTESITRLIASELELLRFQASERVTVMTLRMSPIVWPAYTPTPLRCCSCRRAAPPASSRP